MIPQPLYDQIVSLMPIVCVDVAIVNKGSILLVKRRDEPMPGHWWLPGGRLFKGETLDACAYRKALEETGLECAVDQMIHYASTDFGSVHSVNFVYLLRANSREVKLDPTCLSNRWVSDIEDGFHRYIKASLIKALAWT